MRHARDRYGRTDARAGVAPTRTFANRRYALECVCAGPNAHDEAKDEADTLRSMRWRARIVKLSGGRWAVYAQEA